MTDLDDALKADYRRMTDPTGDHDHTVDEEARVRAELAELDPAWLAAYDVELAEWIKDVDDSIGKLLD